MFIHHHLLSSTLLFSRAGALTPPRPPPLGPGPMGFTQVVAPFPDRPTEGFLHFNVELGPMAAASMGEVCVHVVSRALLSLCSVRCPLPRD